MKVLNQRQLRIGEQVRHILAEIISRDSEFATRMITVGEVRVSTDLRNAEVWVSTLDAMEPGDNICADLAKARYRFEAVIRKQMATKRTPRLRFVLDDGYDYAAHMETVIAEAARK